MRTRPSLCMAFVLAVSAPLSAHDFWLDSERATPVSDQLVTIRAGIGERFPTRTGFRASGHWLPEWRVIGLDGDVAVTGEFHEVPDAMATDVMLPSPGAYLAVATVTPIVAEMHWREFNSYLLEEGLYDALAVREALGESESPALERYTRFAKVALRTGPGDGTHLTRRTGADAEFVPLADPTRLRTGQTLAVQLFIDGAPAANATVSAVTSGATMTSSTDASGRVSFLVDRPGAWLIKAIHMERRPDAEDVPWRSSWVTLTFHAAP